MQVPVLITGVPPGMGLQSDRVAATEETAHGRIRISEWDPLNRLAQVIGDEKTTREERLLPGDDTWLYLNVGPYSAGTGHGPERNVHANIALTLLSEEEITPLAPGGRATRVPQGGLCWVMGTQGMIILCSWPAPGPVYAAIRFRTKGGKAGFDAAPLSNRLFGDTSYGPCSSAGGLWQTASTFGGLSSEPEDVFLVSRRVLAHFERGVDIHGTEGGLLP
jgi:hypothetical protein